MRPLIIYLLLFLVIYKAHGQIEGIVIDKKRIAVSNAIVVAVDSVGQKQDTVKSDKRGGYSFKGLKPGKYNVTVNALGFLPFTKKNIEITTAPEGTDEGDDTYYAVRVDFILLPPKVQK